MVRWAWYHQTVRFPTDEIRSCGAICRDMLSMSGYSVRLLDCFLQLVRKQNLWVMSWLCLESPGIWAKLLSIHLGYADLMLKWGNVLPGPRVEREQDIGQGQERQQDTSQARGRVHESCKGHARMLTQRLRKAIGVVTAGDRRGMCLARTLCGPEWEQVGLLPVAAGPEKASFPIQPADILIPSATCSDIPLGPRNLTKNRALGLRVKFYKCSGGIVPWWAGFSFFVTFHLSSQGSTPALSFNSSPGPPSSWASFTKTRKITGF